ncbi:hypothetical protein DFJ77DRAFT_29398 [Powellomyces hirtus]|nr:hypothetical protein DFJ77DRAFT_29398 [Powellomyces hirtus]
MQNESPSNSRYGHNLYALSPDGNPYSPLASVAAQCAHLQTLKRSSVALLIGRGVGEEFRWWTAPSPPAPKPAAHGASHSPESTEVHYIPTDVFGGAFSTPGPSPPSDPPSHLWLSFTNPNDLSNIAAGSISHIVFDHSTWRYMTLTPPVLREWARILRSDGWIAFDASIASIRLSACAERHFWDCDNPTHAVVADQHTYDSVVGLLGRKTKHKVVVRRAATTVLPAPIETPAEPHPLLQWLGEAYSELFAPAGFERAQLIEDESYPVRTRGHIQPWFKLLKIQAS